jgi:hypothetical protein
MIRTITRTATRSAIALVAAGTMFGLTAPLAQAASAPAASANPTTGSPKACDGSVKPGERAGIIAVKPGERAGIIAVTPAPSCPG